MARRDVRLSTQFVAGSQTNQCGNSTIGQATDLRAAGPGVGATAPATTMVIVMPKDTLKGFGMTSSRNGLLRGLPRGAEHRSQQHAEDVAAEERQEGPEGSSIGPRATSAEGRAWGVPADCGTAGLAAGDVHRASDEAGRRHAGVPRYNTKQVAELGIKDADLVIIIRKGAPWDGKGGVF